MGILNKAIIALTSHLDESNANIKRWVEANGGKLTSGISAQVTHLVCSNVDWKNQSPVVKSALERKRIKIVKLDWLMNCLATKKKRETDFLWKNNAANDDEKDDGRNTTANNGTVAGRKKAVKRKKNQSKARLKSTGSTGRSEAKTSKAKRNKDIVTTSRGIVNKETETIAEQTFNYETYSSPEGSRYSVTLIRPAAHGHIESHDLSILENGTAEPALYCTVSIYQFPGAPPQSIVLADPGSSFEKALKRYNKFCLALTGVAWDDRNRDACRAVDQGWWYKAKSSDHTSP